MTRLWEAAHLKSQANCSSGCAPTLLQTRQPLPDVWPGPDLLWSQALPPPLPLLPCYWAACSVRTACCRATRQRVLHVLHVTVQVGCPYCLLQSCVASTTCSLRNGDMFCLLPLLGGIYYMYCLLLGGVSCLYCRYCCAAERPVTVVGLTAASSPAIIQPQIFKPDRRCAVLSLLTLLPQTSTPPAADAAAIPVSAVGQP